jgi:hypothetical protein
MIHWLAHLFGRDSRRDERQAQAAENSVDRLEEQAVIQEERLNAATKRVSKAVEQVRRVEELARKRHVR